MAYNIRLLKDAGSIDGIVTESMTGDGAIGLALARYLTNSGHELLDTIRSETVWNKIQEKFKTSGVDITIDLVLMIGKKIAESLLLS